MWLAALVSTAFGCAGLVHAEGELAESGASEAVFEVLDGAVEVTYEVVYEGDAEAFGWIVPVPADVLAVEDGDEALLEAVRSASEPEVYVESVVDEGGGGCGCLGVAGSAKSDRSNEVQGGSVTVVAEGFTGTYAYIVVEATDTDALDAWAVAGGWALGSVNADLQHYLDLGHPLVLLDLAPDAPADGLRALPPIRIRYGSEELRFPSKMARAAGQAQRTTVYVLGDGRASVVEGWSHEDVDDLEGNGEAAEVFADALAELGADRTWARTWSGSSSGRHLTRFDLFAEADQHDRDTVFGFDGTTTSQGLTIFVWGGNEAWVMLPLGLLLVAAGRRRRP